LPNKKFFRLCAAIIFFVASTVQAAELISTEDLAKINSWGNNRPSNELYVQYKSVFDNPLYYNQETGAINWPTNDGFAQDPYSQTLGTGTWLDRFGADTGKFVCPAGIDYGKRSCAPGTEDRAYSVFVTKDYTIVQAGLIAPWFDEQGGGIQYLLPDSVKNLIDSGKIRRVEQREFASNDHVQHAIILQENSMVSKIVAERADAKDTDLWLNFSKRFGELKNDGKYHGSTFSAGVDNQRNEHWRDGIFFIYGTTSYASGTADAKIHDARAGLYTAYKNKKNSAFLYVDYGWQRHHLNRYVDEIYLNASAKYHSQLAEAGGEFKHDIHAEDGKIWHVSPFVNMQASYLHQPAYVEKITKDFGQRVTLKDNVYAATQAGVEFKRNVNSGNYAFRIGCKYSFAGNAPKVRFNYANYDQTTYRTHYKQDKVHFVAALSGNFDFNETWQATFDAALQKGAHDRDLTASVFLRKRF